MTWYYSVSDNGQYMDVYEQDSEFIGHITTIENDGSGFEIPNDINIVMRKTWEEQASLGQSPVMSVRAGNIMMDMICGCIEEGVPDSLQE